MIVCVVQLDSITVGTVHDVNLCNYRELDFQRSGEKSLQCEPCWVSSQPDIFLAVFIYSRPGIPVVSSGRYARLPDVQVFFLTS
jgi:hypothetical protein